jgi:hypothetical protein
MGLHPILVQINSPLLEAVRILREEISRKDDRDESTPELAQQATLARGALAEQRIARELHADDAAQIETVFCFIHPAPELRQIMSKGREVFRETAQREIGDKLHPVQFAELQRRVNAWYLQSFATIVKYEAARNGDDTVFTTPPATTVSAGGSTSSAS